MNLKELYQIAKNELSELSPFENSDFRLEQAEFDKDEKVWEIVISYLVENTNWLFRCDQASDFGQTVPL